jgi:molecular chaperone DnaK (HSP70)
MSEVAVDFGTSNTVLARFNETTGRAETIQIPGITSEMRYRLAPGGPEHAVWLVPSMIHYSDTEVLIGDQVLSRGLAEHPSTIRWMKRAVAHGVTKRRKTPQGHISPQQAGEDFLRMLLNYASDRLSLDEDSFTFTAPVEAFENFQDWLFRLCESLGVRRVRLLDEPTACVFGYQGAARRDERFVVFDFGGGTLDVSAVRIDVTTAEDKKAVVLGQAGRDLGGMNIDQWLAADFCKRHNLDDHERRQLEAVILRQAEARSDIRSRS